MTRLEKINFDYGPNARSGWVTRTLHMGNIPFDAIFESLDELFQSKVSRLTSLQDYANI